MFYDKQPKLNQEGYKEMLSLVGSLSRLFSESQSPFLNYRAHENIFCKYFDAENASREDCSADAIKNQVGIGLKTWVGNDDQKVAEFGRLKPEYDGLTGLELIKKIAFYRNERIRITKRIHGLNELLYHVVKRVPGAMKIFETAFEPIEIERIQLLPASRGNANNTYFTDGKHVYHFSTSKNTLYMIFENMVLLDEFDVEIAENPYDLLKNMFEKTKDLASIEDVIVSKSYKHKPIDSLCLRLYTLNRSTKQKEVAEKSGLNQWNAAGRVRNPNEIYIPYPKVDRERKEFFPPRDTSFDLLLPDNQWIKAKICQSDGKAIMSNPNKLLGEWLLRNVFQLEEGTLVTYDMLKIFGVDSVIFCKYGDLTYSVDFCSLGTYEKFYGEDDVDDIHDVERLE